MPLASASSVRIPVVAVCCAMAFAVYALWATEQQIIDCHHTDAHTVQCQVQHSLLFNRVPTFATQFQLEDVAIQSELCDNTPRGGVRFCHHLTLLASDARQYVLPEFRSPLAAATIENTFRDFIQGRGEEPLTLPPASQPLNSLNLIAVGLLLVVAAWGFWDLRWPPQPISPLAMDGVDTTKPSKP